MSSLFDSTRIYNTMRLGTGGSTRAFTCPYCKGIASHDWVYSLRHNYDSNYEIILTNVVIAATCQACNQTSIWLKNEDDMMSPEDNYEILIYPKISNFEDSPNPDMPTNVRKVFEEAALILDDSPRASAALSRLAIDILSTELKAEGKNLNERIGNLVSKGLPIQIQQALDAIRVIGNNAVHPGEIDMSDNKELAISLLKFINIIVDNQITQPKLIEKAYSSLPQGVLKSITNRDKT